MQKLEYAYCDVCDKAKYFCTQILDHTYFSKIMFIMAGLSLLRYLLLTPWLLLADVRRSRALFHQILVISTYPSINMSMMSVFYHVQEVVLVNESIGADFSYHQHDSGSFVHDSPAYSSISTLMTKEV